MSVASEVDAFLAKYDAGPLGAVAKALAVRLDDPDEASPAPVAKELRATLSAIADTPAKEADPVDEITARRSARRSRATG